MLINQYLTKEIRQTFIAVFIVLLLILVSSLLLRYLSAVVDGQIPLNILFALLGLKILASLPMLLPLVLFLSVLLALSRFYRDSEMVAMGACGLGPAVIIDAVLMATAGLIIIEGILALYVSPWAYQKVALLQDEAEVAAEVSILEPGRFNESSLGDKVLYVENLNAQGDVLEHVFLYLREGDKISVLAARQAMLKNLPEYNGRYLIFNKGTRYDGIPGKGDFNQVTFDQYGVLINNAKVTHTEVKHRAQSLTILWSLGRASDMAEIQWRISLFLSAIILILLAVPLSETSPRQGRYAKILVALLLYIVYANMLTISRTWIKKEFISPWLGVWWVHALFFLLFIILLLRQYHLSWLRFPTKKMARNRRLS